jgi:hypothetical protein
MRGGQRTENTFVIADLVVGPSGQITFQEFIPGLDSSTTQWVVRNINNAEVNLEKTSVVMCGGSEHRNHANYNSKLDTSFGLLRLQMEANEKWCPNLNCTFLTRYSLLKKGSYEQRIESFKMMRRSMLCSYHEDCTP